MKKFSTFHEPPRILRTSPVPSRVPVTACPSPPPVLLCRPTSESPSLPPVPYTPQKALAAEFLGTLLFQLMSGSVGRGPVETAAAFAAISECQYSSGAGSGGQCVPRRRVSRGSGARAPRGLLVGEKVASTMPNCTNPPSILPSSRAAAWRSVCWAATPYTASSHVQLPPLIARQGTVPDGPSAGGLAPYVTVVSSTIAPCPPPPTPAFAVYLTFHVSGGHINPVVSLAAAGTGHIDIARGLTYAAAQVGAGGG